jgi:hypothetical protein
MLRVVDNDPEELDQGIDTRVDIKLDEITNFVEESIDDQENIRYNICDYTQSTTRILKSFDHLYKDHI